jgi:type VI secretion system protein VasJ
MGGVGVLSDLGGVASVEDLFGALGPVFSFLDSASEVLGQLDASHPMAITLRRLGARGRISSSPPANGQKTYIPAPPFADQSSFDAILQSGNSDGILAFCESRISTYPFWFDLDCESAKAYSARGPSASHMREGIISALLEFLDRLPGVENLTFSDGQAFASDKTRAWIAACRESRSGGGGDRFSVLRKQAIDAVNEGQFETAVGLLHAYVDGSRSGREQFRARLALAEIALAEKRDFDPLPFVDPLVDEVERLKLPDWEPDLAVAAWTLKLRACRDAAVYYRKVGNFAKAEAVEAEVSVALKAVSVLDFGQALRQI